ncbi:hypothetical protein GGR51DRAFT_501204 [Nemania sp. FL0031]|nr:hypothetical protein GGR51DRAFT_501204 [Nemania sp. FL0031]
MSRLSCKAGYMHMSPSIQAFHPPKLPPKKLLSTASPNRQSEHSLLALLATTIFFTPLTQSATMAANDPRPRIIGHMNSDHSAELKLYLRAFNKLSPSAAADAQMTDITLTSMTIKSASGVHTVQLTPAMKSFADARVRLVDMAAQAQETLGLSDIRITRFTGPAGYGLVSFLGVALYFVSAAAVAAGLVRPGSTLWGVIDPYFPYGANGYLWLIKAIFLPVLAIHATETWWMARSRLAKYGVETGSAVWFLWVLETFLEGYPAFVRFDGMAREERAKKEAAKH